MKLEDCIRKQEMQMNALREERDNLQRLSDELKMDIRLKDDKVETITNELQDTMRKAKEGKFNVVFVGIMQIYDFIFKVRDT